MNTSRKRHEFLLKRYPDAHTITRQLSGLIPEDKTIQSNENPHTDSFFSQLSCVLPAYPANKNPFDGLQRSVAAVFYQRIKKILSRYEGLLSNPDELAQNISKQCIGSLPEDIHQLCFLAAQMNRSTPYRFADWKDLFEHYPMIEKMLTLHERHLMSTLTEVLAKLDKDKELLTNTFKISQFSIKKIVLALGDFHQVGKTIVRIDFSQNAVIYKPRSADNEAFTLALLDLLHAEIMHIRIGIPAFINMHEYSWHEYLAFQPVDDTQQALDYYRNIGAALLFFHLINGSGFDRENIICVKNTPYFIDLAMILSRPQQRGFFTGSVLNTGIIPELSGNPAERYDCGIGIPADEEAELLRQSMLSKQNTGQPFGIEHANNIPVLVAGSVTHDAIKNAVNEGFDSMRQLIKLNQKIIPFINSYPSLAGRVQFRSKHAYLEMMRLIRHPVYAADSEARKSFLSSILYDETKPLDLLQYEYRAVSEGRVPLFYMTMANGKYFTAEGQELNISDNHSFKYSMTKVFRMINTDDESTFQKKLINLSLDTLYPGRVVNIKKQDFFEKTVDFMAGEEIPYKKKNLILNIETDVNGGKTIKRMRSDIYHGLSGAAFLQLCNVITNRSPLKEKKLQNLYFMANKYNTDETFGCFEMNGSLLYLEYLFYKNMISWFDISTFNTRLFDIISMIRKRDAHTDIFSGIAGVLIVCSRMHLLCPNRIYKSAISYLASTLMHKAIRIDDETVTWGNKETGFARGNSGIVYALLLANNILNNRDINQLAIDALKYEQKFKTIDGWNSVEVSGQDRDLNGWYQGATGIYLSRVAMLEENYFESNEIIDILCSDIAHYNNTKKERPLNQRLSLCHGLYGNAMIDPLSYAESVHIDYSAYTPSEDKSLMNGRPGALYAHLFIHQSNRRIPNLLLLK